MIKKHSTTPAIPEFPRADPAELVKFDPASKVCTMNCGKHSADPRSDAERKFLCDECLPCEPWSGTPRRDCGLVPPLRTKVTCPTEDELWEEFQRWHMERYGWNLRDDRHKSSDRYTSMVAWYAWLTAAQRYGKRD